MRPGPGTPLVGTGVLPRAHPYARSDEMSGPATPSCPACGAELVLEMDPTSPPDAQSSVLLADPPFRYVCQSATCARAGGADGQ